MTYTSTFGGILGREQVEQAVLTTFQTPPAGSSYPLIVYYLAEVERQRGLNPRTLPVPPGPDSYRGGLDFDTFEEQWAPQLTVLAEPVGSAERHEEGVYGQWYEIRVGALVTEVDEDAARLLADRYGAAVGALLAQNGGLGTRVDFTTGTTIPFATKTNVESVPRTEYPDPLLRRFVRSVVTLHTFVDQIVQEDGPQAFGPDPYATPLGWPTITTVDVQLEAENASGVFNTATGVAVTESVSGGGQIVVNE